MQDGVMKPLQRLQASEAMEMLGIYISPSGNQSRQVDTMRQITETWAASQIPTKRGSVDGTETHHSQTY